MPGQSGTYVIDAAATFSAAILLGVEPRMKFGSQDEHEVNRDGVKKWSASVAVTFAPANGMPATSDILTITITQDANPGESVSPGTAVTLEGLRVGISAPEIRTRKDSDQARVSGGKAYLSAAAIRPVVQGFQRKSEAA